MRSAELERPITGWSADVEAWLERQPWPGNARELENAIERGVVLSRGERLELDDLLIDADADGATPETSTGAGLRAFLDGAAADRIRTVLEETGGKRGEAAARLGVDRTTLYRLIRRLGIEG